MSSPQQIAQVLTALGLSISHPIDADPLRAAELLELSEGHAGPPAHPGKIAPSSLSFGDALILAIAERLQGPVVTRDTYWKWMVDNGLIGVTVLTF